MNQAQLVQMLKALFPSAIQGSDYTLAVDGSGNATIQTWNNALGTQPTVAQLTAELATLQLQAAQVAQITSITAAYTTARYGTPVSLTSGQSTLSFPTTQICQTNVTGYLTAFTAANAPATMPLLNSSGTVQALSYAQLQTLAQTIANNSMTVWQKLMTLTAQINAATTITAVQAVVWS